MRIVEDKENLEKLEEALDYIKKKNVYVEDIFEQVKFLENLEDEICNMYSEHGKHFQCQFTERKEKLSEAFFEFTDSLTQDLGMILEHMFIARNRLRENVKCEKYTEDEILKYIETGKLKDAESDEEV